MEYQSLPQLPGGYLWILCVTSVTRYCMTLCCVRGVIQYLVTLATMVTKGKLPSNCTTWQRASVTCLWLPLVTSVTRYCKTLCCVHGVSIVTSVTWWLPVWLPVLPGIARLYAVYMEYQSLPQLPGGYLWLPLVTSVTRYCKILCCARGVSIVTSVTWWLPVVTFGYPRYQVLLDSMLCTWSMVTSVTWWLSSCGSYVCYQRYFSCLVHGYLWLPLVTMEHYQVCIA